MSWAAEGEAGVGGREWEGARLDSKEEREEQLRWMSEEESRCARRAALHLYHQRLDEPLCLCNEPLRVLYRSKSEQYAEARELGKGEGEHRLVRRLMKLRLLALSLLAHHLETSLRLARAPLLCMLRTCVRLPTAARRPPSRPPRLAMSTSRAAPRSPSPTPRRKRPLVAVIGTTGVGKTDLGVELALALSSRPSSSRPPTRAEVLNHDSMQCYRGLDVITNKATRDEMRGVPHHLMGFLEPGREWGVNDFVRDALDKVRSLSLSSGSAVSLD